jgi:hypothetical protein
MPAASHALRTSLSAPDHHMKAVYQFDGQCKKIAPALEPRLPKSRQFDAFCLNFELCRDAGGLPRVAHVSGFNNISLT